MKLRFILGTVLVAAALGELGCTSSKVSVPSLTGPSTFGLGMSLQASPDVIEQDGVHSSTITIQTRGEDGSPKSGVGVTLAVMVDGVSADFGTLSKHSLTTDGDGESTVFFTPPKIPAGSGDTGTIVSIVATPNDGGNFANAVAQSVEIRLVPPSTLAPPSGFAASFSFTPSVPAVLDDVLFDAGSSVDSHGTITSYQWDFDDGEKKSGQVVTHDFASARTYTVRLTITDDRGRTTSTTRQVTVGVR
jgi:PKD repeat protein